MGVHRDIPTALTWSLGSSFSVLSVLSVPYVVWQDVLLLPWLETPFHMCSQNPEPSAKPHLLAESTGECRTDTLPYNSTAATFPQLSHRVVLRCITSLLSSLNNARIKLGGNVTCEECWWKQRDRELPRQTRGRLRRKESKHCGSGFWLFPLNVSWHNRKKTSKMLLNNNKEKRSLGITFCCCSVLRLLSTDEPFWWLLYETDENIQK